MDFELSLKNSFMDTKTLCEQNEAQNAPIWRAQRRPLKSHSYKRHWCGSMAATYNYYRCTNVLETGFVMVVEKTCDN